MQTPVTSRAIMPLWMMLLSLTLLAASSPAPAPEPAPAPIDPSLAAVIASNLNLACTNGCSGSSNAQQLDTNGATVGSAVSPLHLFGTVAIVGGVLAAL